MLFYAKQRAPLALVAMLALMVVSNLWATLRGIDLGSAIFVDVRSLIAMLAGGLLVVSIDGVTYLVNWMIGFHPFLRAFDRGGSRIERPKDEYTASVYGAYRTTSDITCALVEGRSDIAFLVAVPDGEYTVWVIASDAEWTPPLFEVWANGQKKLDVRIPRAKYVFMEPFQARATGGHLHVAHVSTRGAVDLIRRARAEGVRVTADATPHHLALDCSCCRGYSTEFKMNPPLREPEDVAAVVEGLVEGAIDCIATDHAPHTAMEKELQFDETPFGVVGLETALAVGITFLVREGRFELGELIRRMSERPAEIFDLPAGRLEEGAEADFILLDPGETWIVEPRRLHSKGKNTAFAGQTLTGRVKATFLRGRLTYRDGEGSLEG